MNEKVKAIDIEPGTQEAAIAIYNHLRVESDPAYGDAIYILGGSTLGPAERASLLYHEGFASKIACVSKGGTFAAYDSSGNMISEASRYKQYLTKQGIHPDDLWMVDETPNTLAEAKRAIPFMCEKGATINTLILCSRPFHQRRAWGTFRNQYPTIDYLNCPAADEVLDTTRIEHLQRLVGEIEREVGYTKKGDLNLPPTPYEVLDATDIVREALMLRGLYVKWELR